jgi:nucleotide-binding universal stress UspA family protein
MSFTKILCPIDFSAGSEQALRIATRVAVESNAELVIAHAWYVPRPAFAGEFMFPGHVIQDMVDESQRQLDAAVKRAVAAGAKQVSGDLISGLPWTEIVALLEHQAFDLCVVGTHGRTGLARVLLGSVAEAVVRHSPCSVLAVRPDTAVEPFRNVLVPTDFSECARCALEQAIDVVQPDGAVTLLHVVDVPTLYSGPAPFGDYAHELGERAEAALTADAKRVTPKATTTIATRTRFGSPGAQVLAALSDDRSVDLVVTGSHGRTGLKRMMMGSVAEKVVRHAPCPVLVARRRA